MNIDKAQQRISVKQDSRRVSDVMGHPGATFGPQASWMEHQMRYRLIQVTPLRRFLALSTRYLLQAHISVGEHGQICIDWPECESIGSGQQPMATSSLQLVRQELNDEAQSESHTKYAAAG